MFIFCSLPAKQTLPRFARQLIVTNAATLCGTAYCNEKGAAGCVDRDSSIL